MRKLKRRRKPSRKKRPAALIAVIAAAVVICAAVAVHIETAIRPAARMQAEHYSRKTAYEIINGAASDYLAENQCTYGDFAAVLYGEDGKAVSVEALTANINRVQTEMTCVINKALSEASDRELEIPLGSVTDSFLLAGRGMHIKVRVCPAGEASIELKSSFTSAGINQTCHRISALIKVNISSSIPLYSFDTEVETEILLAESVIVGNSNSLSVIRP